MKKIALLLFVVCAAFAVAQDTIVAKPARKPRVVVHTQISRFENSSCLQLDEDDARKSCDSEVSAALKAVGIPTAAQNQYSQAFYREIVESESSDMDDCLQNGKQPYGDILLVVDVTINAVDQEDRTDLDFGRLGVELDNSRVKISCTLSVVGTFMRSGFGHEKGDQALQYSLEDPLVMTVRTGKGISVDLQNSRFPIFGSNGGSYESRQGADLSTGSRQIFKKSVAACLAYNLPQEYAKIARS